MSLQVFFDGTLIDEKYYTELTNSYEMFNQSFKLGSTPCNMYKLQIAKEGIESQPSVITLKDNGTTFAELTIDNIEEKDGLYYEYTLTDKMVNLDFYYDASEIFQNGTTTLLLIVQDICTKAGLTLGTVDFRGYNKNINWYDNTRTARDYIGMVAELNGGFARIENGVLYFRKQKTTSAKTISIDDCEDFTVGEYHKITRVVYELGALKYEFGDETGNTLYLNSDNVYITEESEVQAIYNEIVNLEFYSFKTANCPIDYAVKTGDIITFTDGENDYPTIAQYDLNYFGGWIGGYNLSINTEKQEETKIVGDKENIRNLKIIVDRQNNSITQVVEEVGEQNTKISQVQQTVNELNSKISDIADITTQAESIYASLDFTGINQSEPVEIKIHPTTTNISYLYPMDTLYPSDTLYMPNRVLRFTNTDTDEVFDYELPDDLLINANTGTYDEFYLGYDDQICQVTKRCGYNADGTVSDLANEVINTYTYPTINLTDGDYTIEIIGYNNGYISARLMSQNIYTTQFATKAEVSSSINQSATEITTNVSATYETKQNAQTNYSQLTQTANNISTEVSTKVGENEIISKINQSAEAIQIDADKISLNGKTINLTADNTTISSSNFTADSNGTVAINGGTRDNPNFQVQGTNGFSSIIPTKIYLEGQTGGLYINSNDVNSNQQAYIYNDNGGGITLGGNNSNDIVLRAYTGDTPRITCYGKVQAQTYENISLEESKKNFEKFENALSILENIDIYKFNYKNEKKDAKKHIGFIIGKNYKFSKELTSEDNNAVDIYSFVSVCCKAIQEQQEQIEKLQEGIKELKGEK